MGRAGVGHRIVLVIVATAAVLTLGLGMPTVASAQWTGKPAATPEYVPGRFGDYSDIHYGPDYRLTVWGDGTALFTHDDGSLGQIQFTDIRPGPNGRDMAVGRVTARPGGDKAPPLGALVALQPRQTFLKPDYAVFGVFLDAPGNPVVFAHRICHATRGNGAWETAWPCW